MKKIFLIIVLLYTYIINAQVLINSFDTYPVIEQTSSLYVSGLVSLYDSSSIDVTATIEGDPVGTWTDLISDNNATQSGTSKPVLHLDGGIRQVRFNGATSWLDIGTPANLDFAPGTDEFSVVIKLGGGSATGGYILSKAPATPSLRQYGFVVQDENDLSVVIGGTTYGSIAFTYASNSLLIYTISTTAVNLRGDGVALLTGAAIGTATTTANVNIGTRTNEDGGNNFNGDLEFIAIYNKVLSAEEISAIEAEFNVNFVWVVLLGFKRRNKLKLVA